MHCRFPHPPWDMLCGLVLLNWNHNLLPSPSENRGIHHIIFQITLHCHQSCLPILVIDSEIPYTPWSKGQGYQQPEPSSRTKDISYGFGPSFSSQRKKGAFLGSAFSTDVLKLNHQKTFQLLIPFNFPSYRLLPSSHVLSPLYKVYFLAFLSYFLVYGTFIVFAVYLLFYLFLQSPATEDLCSQLLPSSRCNNSLPVLCSLSHLTLFATAGLFLLTE